MTKITWQERAKETERFHKERIRLSLSNPNFNHKINDTARLLRRSHGAICEDLMIASWMKTYPDIEKFKYTKDAIEWIRKKKLEIKLR